MVKKNNSTSYPPAPTPDELKNHSKKYIFILIAVVIVLIIAALVLITYPKEEVVVKEEALVVIEELGFQMYDTHVCSEMDTVFNCITEANVFAAREVSISYKVKGYESERKASPHENVEKYFFNLQDEHVVLLQKEMGIFDENGNKMTYNPSEFMPRITMPIRFKQGVPEYLFSGETFNFDEFAPGNYYVEVALTDMFTNERITERFAFTLQ